MKRYLIEKKVKFKKYLIGKIVKFLNKQGYEVIKKGEALFVLKHYLLIPTREDAVLQINGGSAQIVDNIFESFKKENESKILKYKNSERCIHYDIIR